MSWLWLIIKIIVGVLLGSCVLILILAAVILLAPIRYEAYLAKYEKLSYDIKFSYLGGIRGLFYLEGEEKNHRISIFGKVIYKNKVEEIETPNKASTSNKEEQEVVKEKQVKIKEDDRQSVVASKKASKSMEKTSVEIKKEVNPQLRVDAEEATEAVNEDLKEATIETVKHMSYEWVKEFVLNATTYRAIKRIAIGIGRIIKTIFPYQWDFEVVVGEGEPADTGLLIAKLTMLYPLYYGHGIVRGNYEQACLQGGFLAKGKFTLGAIGWQILCCVLNKQVQALVKSILKLRKEERNGDT